MPVYNNSSSGINIITFLLIRLCVPLFAVADNFLQGVLNLLMITLKSYNNNLLVLFHINQFTL